MRNRLLAALLTAGAIGSAGAAGQHEGHHHHRFAADVDAFHSVLAPVWHAAPGKERNRNACWQTARMAKLVQEIRSADAGRLQASIDVLKERCRDAKDGVEEALSDVHDEFHRLIEAGAGS